MAWIRRQDVAVLRLTGRVLVDRPRRQRQAEHCGGDVDGHPVGDDAEERTLERAAVQVAEEDRADHDDEARRAAGGMGRDGYGRFALLIDLYVDGLAARVRAATA